MNNTIKKDSILYFIAKDLYERFGNDMSGITIVFPNKRASLFLNEYIASVANGPVWAPSYMTISDFFQKESMLKAADQILLISLLHKVFVKCTGFQNETLDQFYGWGKMLLADFDDIDKNMGETDKIFTLVSDLHQLDNVDYLTDKQKEALGHFFSTFSDDQSSIIKEKFKKLWSQMYNIYTEYKATLREEGIGYEGMIYRDVAEQFMKEDHEQYNTYCFIGFNMLQKVEQQIFRKLQSEKKALFYWDYDTFYTTNTHEAGHFIKQYLTLFPDALANKREEIQQHSIFTMSDTDVRASVNYISSVTETSQSQYVAQWLKENNRWQDGSRTAIIMSDEHQLQNIIAALPDEIKDVNITSGYPLEQTPMITFINALIDIQTIGTGKRIDSYRLTNVLCLLRHPYMSIISENVGSLVHSLTTKKIYNPTLDDLCIDEALTLVFRYPKEQNTNEDISKIKSQNEIVLEWISLILSYMADTNANKDVLLSEVTFCTYQIVNRLLNLIQTGKLECQMITLRRLLVEILKQTSIPFHGEPIQGVQIMGVLETRCLDFDHILILSCNEGNMPKGVNDTSFIPHSVRQAYELTTVDNKVGIYSYYFYRMLQHCKDVTICYNTSTEGTKNGEMSRFMLQLMVESNIDIKKYNITSKINSYQDEPIEIVKDDIVSDKTEYALLKTKTDEGKPKAIYPTSLSQYLRCQVAYFFKHICNIKEPDELVADTDNRVFGNIFHKAAEILLNTLANEERMITKDALENVKRNKILIDNIVDAAIDDCVNINKADNKIKDFTKPSNKSIEYSGIQLINREVVKRLINDLIDFEITSAPIKLIGTEQKIHDTITITHRGDQVSIPIAGIIDCLDMVKDKDGNWHYRVIDYKTGNSLPGEMTDVSSVFERNMPKAHADYYLQTMFYAWMASKSRKLNPDALPVTPTLLFIQKSKAKDYNPTLIINKQAINDIGIYASEYEDYLRKLIEEILDSNISFQPNYNQKTCNEYCAYYKICMQKHQM